MIVYRLDRDRVEPTPVECEILAHPHRDADGETIYDNTHFASLTDAWEKQRRNVEAQVTMAGYQVDEAQSRLRRAEEDAGRAAARFAKFMDSYSRFAAPTPALES